MSVQLPYAILLATGRLIHISEAKNGADCGCICPECRKPLVARQGNEYAHCFAHESDSDCHGALETTLHMNAK
jgi:competence CoiA-like predicted nuclease